MTKTVADMRTELICKVALADENEIIRLYSDYMGVNVTNEGDTVFPCYSVTPVASASVEPTRLWYNPNARALIAEIGLPGTSYNVTLLRVGDTDFRNNRVYTEQALIECAKEWELSRSKR